MSKIIPNSFQTPNAYVDEFMAFLTPEEYVVLSYAARRVLGFHKESDRISLSQFSDGLSRDGAQLDYGTGLNKQTVRKALDALITFGLILQLKPYVKETSTPALFALQLDYDRVDVTGLKRRREERFARDTRRTKAATSAVHPITSDKLPPSTSDGIGVIGLPVTSDDTPPERPTEDPLLRRTEGQKKEEKHRGKPGKNEASQTVGARAAEGDAVVAEGLLAYYGEHVKPVGNLNSQVRTAWLTRIALRVREGWSESDLRKMFDGCALDDWKDRWKWNKVTDILKDRDSMLHFLNLADEMPKHAPRAGPAPTRSGKKSNVERSMDAVNSFIEKERAENARRT